MPDKFYILSVFVQIQSWRWSCNKSKCINYIDVSSIKYTFIKVYFDDFDFVLYLDIFHFLLHPPGKWQHLFRTIYYVIPNLFYGRNYHSLKYKGLVD